MDAPCLVPSVLPETKSKFSSIFKNCIQSSLSSISNLMLKSPPKLYTVTASCYTIVGPASGLNGVNGAPSTALALLNDCKMVNDGGSPRADAKVRLVTHALSPDVISPSSKPSPKTNAERQREYRLRKKRQK
ncbi:hypothetical protein PV326_008257 [Microctonus aethiopoides]|nr:hypothetical protein PV326_008257 [Microctonus aethiopoides]